MVKVTLKDDVVKQFKKGSTVLDVALSISEGLARNTFACEVNGQLEDVRFKLESDCKVNLLGFDSDGGRSAFRHTSAHILAQAVKRLFKDVKLAIGPSIEEGFYYDFDLDRSFTKDEIVLIEKEMKKIVKENLEIETFELGREEALELMKDEPYKVELINDLPEDEKITFYKQGEFVDLCKGPHLLKTKQVKSIKLLGEDGSSGAYWKGDEKNKMLARIYGTSFLKNADLNKYLEAKEEAKKRDHNKLGRELKLFTTSEDIGQGLPLLMPKGAKVIQLLQRFIEDEEEKRGYKLTKTPLMAKSDMYEKSGHWKHYKDGMFILGDEEKDKEVFALRPMTCPFQFTIYNAEQHSYKELPIRYGETSTLFRKESSGEMHGLIRLRQFTISEGHIVCMKEQVEDEIKEVLELINFVMETLGIEKDVKYMLSKWDKTNKGKYIGDEKDWEETQEMLRDALNNLEVEYKEVDGEAAFYGPKIDILFKNVHGKEDTIITVQLDFALAEKFDMTYIDKEGNKVHPTTIHRTSLGCYERTLAMLIEKYAGVFPTWLSPVQVKLLPISDKYNDYTKEVEKKLKRSGIRVEVDSRTEKTGYKIREATLEKVPYICVLGEKEEKDNTIAVRSRKGDEGTVDVEEFIDRIIKEVVTRENNIILEEK